MKKYVWEIEFGNIKGLVEALNSEEAFIIAVRKSKLAPISRLFRFRLAGKKGKSNPWKYQSVVEILRRYNLLNN